MIALMFFFHLFFKKKRYTQNTKPANSNTHGSSYNGETIDKSLTRNLEEAVRLFPMAPDFVVFRFFAGSDETASALLYLQGLSDKKMINENILRPLMYGNPENRQSVPVPTIGGVNTVSSWTEILNAILIGKCVMLVEGRQTAWVYDTGGWPQRAIDDPQLESSLKGAHQGFLETGTQNLGLLRRYLPNNEFRVAEHTVGERGKSKVWVVYLEDVAHPEVLNELNTRIRNIDVDAIINTGELAELIEDNTYSPFPQYILTERPDSAVSHLLQGRFVVIVDRSPSVIIAPTTFTSFFQSVDDYSLRWMIASFVRLLRFAAFMIALLFPAIYISLISYNFEIIPLQLFVSIAESRERVPFPPLIEALMMEITLEMMREAGIRLPAPLGQTIGIVGGIIVGQAAVQAGIVSNIMVIVVASTAIASFIIPSYDMGTAVRLLRFPMMLMAAMFGIIGLVIGFMTIVAHLVSLESLRTPYGSPLAPFRWSDMKDTFVRFPLRSMRRRPKSTRAIQDVRVGRNRPEGDQS